MNDLVDRVRFGGGFSERDRALVADTLSQALGRLSHSDRSWELELSVKDREAPGQTVTLERTQRRQGRRRARVVSGRGAPPAYRPWSRR